MRAKALILIVDDNPANLKVARFALENDGYEVVTAADAEEALLLLRERRPHLILMDIQLPGMDGLELTRQLKADSATREIIIVAVTAYAMKGDREKAIRGGCDGYITKPIDPILLPTQVADQLARSGRAPSAAAQETSPIPAPRPDASSITCIENRLPAAQPAKGSERTILLVEDNPATRRMYRLALETAGYDVMEARDGGAALEVLRHSRPALIIQDLVLPDIDGLVLASKIREELDGPPVPIICVSGFLSRLDEARAVKGGFAQVLVKPIDPFDLLDSVKIHLTSPMSLQQATGQGRLLIVVDDDVLARKLAQVWFASLGYNVLVASDGAEGLELARREHPAAIVSDVLMPKMDGFTFCLTVRRDPALYGIPVILTSSAYTEKADHELARRVGASALLQKAGSLEGVTQALTAALQARPQEASNEPIEVIEHEHDRRASFQLQRQVLENTSLLRRSMLQQAQLAILAGIADALSKNVLVDGVLADVLASCLDMAGVSKGALYLAKGGNGLELEHQIGFSASESLRLRAKFGQDKLFAEIAGSRRVVAVPSPAMNADMAQRLIVDAGVTSLLLVPVTAGINTYGAMLLGARNSDVANEDALAFARVLGAQMGQAVGLAEAFGRLGTSELRYRTLTEHASDAICILTPGGVIQEVNRRLTEILGYPTEQFIGRSMDEFAAPGRANANMDRYHAALAAKDRSPQEYEMRKQSGEVVLLEFSIAEVNIESQSWVCVIGRDVTERKRSEKIQAEQRDELTRSNKALEQFAYVASHDLKEPLRAVASCVQLLQQRYRGKLDARADDYISRTVDGAKRMEALIDDLLTFSRIGRAKGEYGPVPTASPLATALRNLSVSIEESGAKVTWDELPTVKGDAGQLAMLLQNLVGNAIKFRKPAVAPRIHVGAATEGDSVTFSVSDDGIGIAPEHFDRIFALFQRLHKNTAYAGTGIGLAVCKRIVEYHGGRIWVESTVGQGTTFHFLLPVSSELQS